MSRLKMGWKMWLGLFWIAVAGLASGDSWYWDDIVSDDFDGRATPSIIGKKGFALTDGNGVCQTSFRAGAEVPIGWAVIANDFRQTLENYKATWSVLTRVGTYKCEAGGARGTADRWATQMLMFAMQNLGPESSGLGYDGTVKFEAENILPLRCKKNNKNPKNFKTAPRN